MKHFLIITIAFLVASCGASYQANQLEKSFKGNWTLESISYPEASGFFDVELFRVANASCFENSVWNFISNNSSGNFTLDGSVCDKSTNQFTWYIDLNTVENIEPELLLKITTGHKARKVNTGSRIKIKSLSDTEMVWEQNAIFNGKEIKIELTFSNL